MTLLESLVAIVMLGLAAVGFLGAIQTTARATQDASEWVQAMGLAEAAMEESKLGVRAARATPDSLPAGFTRTVAQQPWSQASRLTLVTVTVSLPDGGMFRLHRLVRAP